MKIKKCVVCGEVITGTRLKFCDRCYAELHPVRHCKVCGVELTGAVFNLCPDCRKKRLESGEKKCIDCGAKLRSSRCTYCPECNLRRKREQAKAMRHRDRTLYKETRKPQQKPTLSLDQMVDLMDRVSKEKGRYVQYGELQVMIDKGEVKL